MKNNRRQILISILAVVVIIGLSIYAYSLRGRILSLQRYGYPGIFLIEFIANASVFLPIPGSLVTAAASPLLKNAWLLASVAASGASIGEMFGYLAGRGGNSLVEQTKWAARIEQWMKSYGGLTILVLAAVPNPLFDTAGIAAGALGMPPYQFFLWCLAGKWINRVVVVFGSATLIQWFHLI